MIRALVFDLDDTLMPEASFWDAAFEAACRDTSDRRRIALPALQAAVFGAADRMWRASTQFATYYGIGLGTPSWLLSDFRDVPEVLKHLTGTIRDMQHAAWAMGLAEIGIREEGLAVRLSEAFRAERTLHHEPYADVTPMLDALVGRYDLAILTNGCGDVQRDKLRAVGWESVFSTVVISGELGCGKPDRRAFAHVLGGLNVSADEAVMIGDSLDRDVAPARAVGITPIWLARSMDATMRSDELTIASLDELPSMLERIGRA